MLVQGPNHVRNIVDEMLIFYRAGMLLFVVT
jgi:hypothetical protein